MTAATAAIAITLGVQQKLPFTMATEILDRSVQAPKVGLPLPPRLGSGKQSMGKCLDSAFGALHGLWMSLLTTKARAFGRELTAGGHTRLHTWLGSLSRE